MAKRVLHLLLHTFNKNGLFCSRHILCYTKCMPRIDGAIRENDLIYR